MRLEICPILDAGPLNNTGHFQQSIFLSAMSMLLNFLNLILAFQTKISQ